MPKAKELLGERAIRDVAEISVTPSGASKAVTLARGRHRDRRRDRPAASRPRSCRRRSSALARQRAEAAPAPRRGARGARRLRRAAARPSDRAAPDPRALRPGLPERSRKICALAGVLSGMSRLAEDGFARAALLSGCGFCRRTGRSARADLHRPASRPSACSPASRRPPAPAITLAALPRDQPVLGAGPSDGGRSAVLLALAPRGTPELIALRARFAFAPGRPARGAGPRPPIEAAATRHPAADARAADRDGRGVSRAAGSAKAVAVAKRSEALAGAGFARAQAIAHWLAGGLHERRQPTPRRGYATSTPRRGATMAALQLGRSGCRAMTSTRAALVSGELRAAGAARTRRACGPPRSPIAQVAAQAGTPRTPVPPSRQIDDTAAAASARGSARPRLDRARLR